MGGNRTGKGLADLLGVNTFPSHTQLAAVLTDSEQDSCG